MHRRPAGAVRRAGTWGAARRQPGHPRRLAFRHREARGEYVCLIDADLQNPPEQVITLYRRLKESRADIAQGVRSQIEREKDSRLLFSKGLNFLLNSAFGDSAADSKSGFVLGPRLVMADVPPSAASTATSRPSSASPPGPGLHLHRGGDAVPTA